MKYSNNPILKEESLALTPMVFVMWDERYQAFIQKYKSLNFTAFAQALNEKTGWNAIAQKPEDLPKAHLSFIKNTVCRSNPARPASRPPPKW